MENFIEHIGDEVKRLFATFPQQPMTEHTDVLKREHEAVENSRICLKEFNNTEDRKVRDHCHYTSLYQVYDAHLFIKKLQYLTQILRPSQFLEKFMEILECSTLQK